MNFIKITKNVCFPLRNDSELHSIKVHPKKVWKKIFLIEKNFAEIGCFEKYFLSFISVTIIKDSKILFATIFLSKLEENSKNF